MISAYGIPNCNTVKKSLDWLKENNIEADFHDFKKKGITEDKLNEWCEIFGWETVLNKKGTTWRKLSLEEQQQVKDQPSAVKVLLKYHSAIKRPVIEKDQVPVLIGFDDTSYSQVLK